MSNERDDGGPAFPVGIDPSNFGQFDGDSAEAQKAAMKGMSLRDWFAGQALAGFCGNPFVMESLKAAKEAGLVDTAKIVADKSLEYADAMLAARGK